MNSFGTLDTVFFMHGLGDMGMGWAQLFAMQDIIQALYNLYYIYFLIGSSYHTFLLLVR